MTDWLTVDDVASWLGEATAALDAERLTDSTAAAKAAVERRRSDLAESFATDPFPASLADVKLGATIWAGILYQTRSSPSGPPGFGDETALYDPLGARRAEVMRLIGWRRAVAL